MRKACFTLLVLIFVVASAGALPAQSTGEEEVCVVTVEGQNRNRTVAGAINTECEDRTPVQWHDPPFGN